MNILSDISDTLLKQRLRNRIIEVLANYSDKESVELVGTVEIIEQWYDYVDEKKVLSYDQPVFSTDEINALRRFHNLLENSCRKLPKTWSNTDLLSNMEWESLVASAIEALKEFRKRGMMSEDKEIT